MAPQESDEEYLDDPIQLIDLEQKKITEAVRNFEKVNAEPIFELTDSDGDLYIEKPRNTSKKTLPRFKKLPVTLPVTFFEISRNVQQLNQCKPLFIKVVDCDKHPWYYKKYLNKYNSDTDNEVEFYTKKGKKGVKICNKDDAMNDEGRKIKIRPVASPYDSLKVDSPRRRTSLDRKECRSLERENTDNIKQKALSQQNNLQVDFKKNQGLIGMKITQTHDTSPQNVGKITNETKIKVSKTNEKSSKNKPKDSKQTKVKVHKNKSSCHVNAKANDGKPASVTNKAESISKTNTNITSGINVNDKINEKNVQITETNKTAMKTQVDDTNMAPNNARVADKETINKFKDHTEIQNQNSTEILPKLNSITVSKIQDDVSNIKNHNSTGVARKLNSVPVSKVHSNVQDLKIQNNIAISRKVDSITASKVQADDVVQKNVKTADNSNIVNDKKSRKSKQKSGEISKPTVSSDNQANNVVQSVFFASSQNVQKTDDKINGEKQKTKKYSSSAVEADLLGVKVTKYISVDKLTKKDLGINIPNTVSGISQTQSNVPSENKLVFNEEKSNKGKEVSKTKCYKNSDKTTGNKSMNSKLLYATKTDANKNNILNMKLFKPKKNIPKKGDFSKVIQSNSQKGSCSSNIAVKHDLTKERINTAKKLDIKNVIACDNKKKSFETIDDNVKLITNKIVKNTELDNNDSKSNTNSTQTSYQLNPGITHVGKSTDLNRNITDCVLTSGGNLQPSSFYVDKYVKLMEHSPQKIPNITPESQALSQQSSSYTHPMVEDISYSDNKIKKTIVSFTQNANHLSSKNPNSSVTPKNQRIVETVKQNNNNVPVSQSNDNAPVNQKLPANMNLNTTITLNTSAPNAIKAFNHGGTIQSGLSAGNPTARNTAVIPNQSCAFVRNNVVTGPGSFPIMLNIPPGQKRGPRVIKLSKRNHNNSEQYLYSSCAKGNGNSILQNATNACINNEISGQRQNVAGPLDSNIRMNKNMPPRNLNKIKSTQPHQNMNNHQIGRPIQTVVNARDNIMTNQKPLLSREEQAAHNSHMLSYFHAAAQQISRHSVLQKSSMPNQQNTSVPVSLQQPPYTTALQKSSMPNQQNTSVPVSLQQPPYTTALQKSSMPNQQNTSVPVSLQQPPYTTALHKSSMPNPQNTSVPVSLQQPPYTTALHNSTGSHVLNAVPKYRISQEILPPTCDVAIAHTKPRQDMHSSVIQPRQQLSSQKNIPRIIFRSVAQKAGSDKKPVQANTNFPGANMYPNLYTATPEHVTLQHLYSQNFSSSTQHNVQPYGQGIQQQYPDFSHIPPQNFIHCSPIYDGMPNNMVNPAPYENYWNNYYPTMIPPPPPPPPIIPSYTEAVQQQRPSINQTSASYNQNYITSTPKSVLGTTIIGCNNTGPVRKINILAEPTESPAVKLNHAGETQDFKSVQPPQNKSEQFKHNDNRDQNPIMQKINDENNKKKIPDEQHYVDKADVKVTSGEDHTVSSKREMLEELTKITTIESSNMSPVNDLKRSLPKIDTVQEAIKRPRPGPLSKKLQLNNISPKNQLQISTVAQKGYSPPILPIPTYEKTLEILARSNIADSKASGSIENDGNDSSTNINNLYSCDEKQDKSAKKISIDEYKKRVLKPEDKQDTDIKDVLQVEQIKIEIKSEHPENDQGYDSDSTMRL